MLTVGADDEERDEIDNWRDLVTLVGQAQQRLLEAVEDAGVSAQWFAVLHLLLHAQDHRLPMSRLAREVSITSGGFSKLADRMGREGFIDRRGSEGDKRIRYAMLTPVGLEAAETSENAYQAALAEHVLSVVPPETLQRIVDSLTPLQAVRPTQPTDGEHDVADVEQPSPELADRRNGNRALR